MGAEEEETKMEVEASKPEMPEATPPPPVVEAIGKKQMTELLASSQSMLIKKYTSIICFLKSQLDKIPLLKQGAKEEIFYCYMGKLDDSLRGSRDKKDGVSSIDIS
ncbi:hypothetical protein AXF42_Ash009938 [Apostasia shenzhenica]|uniref:Uncharacterized protein n=1 Tax=Apostasia shenzhenica TaxID=1088818 RepID=A0A2I0ACC8_9ASPA|nr:hypothetical protein AXF42_Ash009938 [Apostasia shenzhenica]